MREFDTVYLLFRAASVGNVEVIERLQAERLSFISRFSLQFLDSLVRALPPFPAMAHCELLVPLNGDGRERALFATYLGSRGADWQEGGAYYTEERVGAWHAIPIKLGSDCVRHVARECVESRGAPYDARMYAFTLPPLRWIARRVFPDSSRAPAICSSLAARILRRAACHTQYNDDLYSWIYRLQDAARFNPSFLYHTVISVVRRSRLATADSRCLPAAAEWSRAEGLYLSVRAGKRVAHSELSNACLVFERIVLARAAEGRTRERMDAERVLATLLFRMNDPAAADRAGVEVA